MAPQDSYHDSYEGVPAGRSPVRRQFLKYMAGGAIAAVGLGYLRPVWGADQAAELEKLCAQFPNNSRCKDYLPGLQAKDAQGQAIAADQLTATVKTGRVLAKGLPNNKDSYLVIIDGKIADYAIEPKCTHFGCTVKWSAERDRFLCPCHGSEFDAMGKAVKGPAGSPLPLVTVVVKQNQVRLVNRKPAVDPRKPVNK